jgi:hypothetical protein
VRSQDEVRCRGSALRRAASAGDEIARGAGGSRMIQECMPAVALNGAKIALVSWQEDGSSVTRGYCEQRQGDQSSLRHGIVRRLRGKACEPSSGFPESRKKRVSAWDCIRSPCGWRLRHPKPSFPILGLSPLLRPVTQMRFVPFTRSLSLRGTRQSRAKVMS